MGDKFSGGGGGWNRKKQLQFNPSMPENNNRLCTMMKNVDCNYFAKFYRLFKRRLGNIVQFNGKTNKSVLS